MNVADVHVPHTRSSLRAPILWGFVLGAINAAAPLGFPWLEPATAYALSLGVIAGVYVGFAVADGRPRAVAIECAVAGVFVVLASASVTGTAWLLVVGYAAHGFKDLLQERHHFVANTRWWPPFWLASIGSSRSSSSSRSQPGSTSTARNSHHTRSPHDFHTPPSPHLGWRTRGARPLFD